MGTILIIGGLVVLIALIFFSMYNGLVRLRNQAKEAFSQIDVQLKRRYDLIPNLVDTVKGYAAHEKETLEAVIEARNKLMTGSPDERMEADSEMQGALKSIFALSEAYPDLKANQNFLNLQESLEETENKVSYSRQHYNSAVTVYNTKIESIPTNIVAGIGGFKKKELLATPETERENVRVSF